MASKIFILVKVGIHILSKNFYFIIVDFSATFYKIFNMTVVTVAFRITIFNEFGSIPTS
jgi:hypothetical protein